MAQGDNMNSGKIIKKALIDTRIAELRAVLNMISSNSICDIDELVSGLNQRVAIFEQIKAMDDE